MASSTDLVLDGNPPLRALDAAASAEQRLASALGRVAFYETAVAALGVVAQRHAQA